MPKQGQFARSHHRQVIKNLRHHQSQQTARRINKQMANDFLLVRFALTSGKLVSAIDRESIQRFFQELTPRLIRNDFDLRAGVGDVLQYVNARVPWQFYYQISTNWPLIEHFLHRELPALPLKQPVIVKNSVDQQWLNQRVGHLLVQRIVVLTLIKQDPNQALQRVMATRLQATIMDATGNINWKQVQALLKAFAFPIDHSLDAGSQKWLTQISQIKV